MTRTLRAVSTSRQGMGPPAAHWRAPSLPGTGFPLQTPATAAMPAAAPTITVRVLAAAARDVDAAPAGALCLRPALAALWRASVGILDGNGREAVP